MTEYEFRKMFPKASVHCRNLNAAVLTQPEQSNALQTPQRSGKGQRRGLMNATEAQFAMILEAQKRRGDILRWEFEAITLRFSGLRYTPDFVVWPPAIAVSGQIKFIEVKGPYISGKFERAIERFRHAKTYYGDRFIFELHQKTRQGWRQII